MPAPVGQLPVWAHHDSFFQRHRAAFWLFIGLVLLTGLAVVSEQLTYLDVFPAGWMFSVLLLMLYVVPVAIAIYAIDLFEREPRSLVIAAFVWGGVVAIGLAGPTNVAWIEIIGKLLGADVARDWGAALAAPPVEETFKFLGLVIIYLIAPFEIDDLMDGFVYGALIGLGFAAVENVQYFVQAIAFSGGTDQLGPVIEMFLLRVVIVGAYMHVLWTGLAGIGFAYYVTRRQHSRLRRTLVMLGMLGLAIGAHMLWNSPLLVELVNAGLGGQLAYGLVKGSPFFIFFAGLVLFARRRERDWFRLATAAHVGEDVLTPQEVDELGGLRRRWRARRQVGRVKGPEGARLMGQLQHEQIKLALTRARTHADDHPEVIAQRDLIRAVRRDLLALPDVVPTTDGQSPTFGRPAALAAPLPPPATFVPTHLVPATGMAAWSAPDAAQAPLATLAAGIQLRVDESTGAWARVSAANGWSGWVDGRLLVAAVQHGWR
jgi:protease PrsW